MINRSPVIGLTNRQISEPTKQQIGIVILAAGASRRMGRPKQLLEFRGLPLLQHAVQAALGSTARPVVVVLGAEAEKIRPVLAEDDLDVVFNPGWQEGMSSSVQAGLGHVLKLEPSVAAVLFMVVDQPFVSAALLEQLIGIYREMHPPLVAARYDGTPGVPALFDQSLFDELMQLKGDKGARPLFRKYEMQMKTVAFPSGAFDLDTPGDYDRLVEEP